MFGYGYYLDSLALVYLIYLSIIRSAVAFMIKNRLVIESSQIRHAARRHYLRLIPLFLALIILPIFINSTTANAVTSISQSYTTADKLSLGSIVSLKKNEPDQVIAALSSNVDGLLGVVINASNSILSFSSDQDNQVQVATNGTLQLLVSNINGDISVGDHITASPVSGVGMKATSNVRIVGIAQGDLSNGTQQTYTDSNGKKQTITIGEIPALVNVAYYFKEPDKTIIPSVLQNLADALAGRTVSALPIIISSAIFIITLTVVVSIVYSMIRSSIISVGRNPMSQSAVYRDIIQLSALVLGILAVGIIAIYLVLTRL